MRPAAREGDGGGRGDLIPALGPAAQGPQIEAVDADLVQDVVKVPEQISACGVRRANIEAHVSTMTGVA